MMQKLQYRTKEERHEGWINDVDHGYPSRDGWLSVSYQSIQRIEQVDAADAFECLAHREMSGFSGVSRLVELVLPLGSPEAFLS